MITKIKEHGKMADDKVFVDGMIIKRRENAPSFVKCSLSFKCKEFYAFMQKNHKDGWLNIDIKVSKQGKIYAEVDTWEPENKQGGGDNWGEPAPKDTRDFSEGDPDDQGSTENIPF
jgi:hypothetical protein